MVTLGQEVRDTQAPRKFIGRFTTSTKQILVGTNSYRSQLLSRKRLEWKLEVAEHRCYYFE